MPSGTRQSQYGCKPEIKVAQSPKSVTPEKKKYPVPVNKLNAQVMSMK